MVLPAREYTLLTGIDAETLPEAETFDTVSSIGEVEMEKAEAIVEAREGESVSASALAALSLEEEMSVERLPL